MRRRKLMIGMAATAAMVGARAGAEPLSLAAISTYFNGLETAEARFLQISDDGARARGRLILHRPGRMRFEYDPPNDLLVLANAGQLGIFDGKSNDPNPEQYPLATTPLNLILRRRVDLSRETLVTAHWQEGDQTRLRLQDPDEPQQGFIELVFANDPVALLGWTIVDAGGARTTLQLSELRLGGSYNSLIFSLNSETNRRGG